MDFFQKTYIKIFSRSQILIWSYWMITSWMNKKLNHLFSNIGLKFIIFYSWEELIHNYHRNIRYHFQGQKPQASLKYIGAQKLSINFLIPLTNNWNPWRMLSLEAASTNFPITISLDKLLLKALDKMKKGNWLNLLMDKHFKWLNILDLVLWARSFSILRNSKTWSWLVSFLRIDTNGLLLILPACYMA